LVFGLAWEACLLDSSFEKVIDAPETSLCNKYPVKLIRHMCDRYETSDCHRKYRAVLYCTVLYCQVLYRQLEPCIAFASDLFVKNMSAGGEVTNSHKIHISLVPIGYI
jgi:hypothetical protein